MIAPNDYSDREFYDRQSFADIIGEAVHNHVTEVPAIEIIGILETAKACVIQKPLKNFEMMTKNNCPTKCPTAFFTMT